MTAKRKPRVTWTEEEQDKILTACLELHKQKPRLSPAELVSTAQLTLQEGRRRTFIRVVDNIPEYLRDRMIVNNLLDSDWKSKKRHRKSDQEEGPIAELKIQIAGLQSQLEGLTETNASLLAELNAYRALPKPPTEAQVVKSFIADILAEADRRGRAIGSSIEPVRAPHTEDIPQFEKDRRKDPSGAASASPSSKPKIALVADFVGSDKSAIHKELSELADLRYLDAPQKFNGLKMFNANGGRIVIWSDHIGHAWESSLKHLGVSYSRYSGSLPGFIEHIRGKLR